MDDNIYVTEYSVQTGNTEIIVTDSSNTNNTNRVNKNNCYIKWGETLKKNTRDAYTKNFRNLLEHYMPGVPLESAAEQFFKLTKSDALSMAEEYVGILYDNGNGYGVAKVNMYISAVNSIVKYAFNHDITDWVFSIKHLRWAPARPTNGPTKDELVEILGALSKKKYDFNCARAYLCICLWFFCGLRVSETISLRVEDVDFKNKTISVIRKRSDIRTKREVTDFILEIIKEYITWFRIESGPIVRSWYGEPMCRSALNRIIARAFKTVGLEKTHPHAFRHSGATLIASNTKSISLLQKYGGWKSIGTPIKYMDDVKHEERQTTEMLENIISGKDVKQNPTD